MVSFKTKVYWIDKMIKWVEESDLMPPQREECLEVLHDCKKSDGDYAVLGDERRDNNRRLF